MTDGTRVDEVLQRLVAQFASPYDFLRELVQNSLDAGADRLDVTLECHRLEDEPDACVFELAVVDTGSGMDEEIIDNELTRLFSSGKADDRTMAGGFGIGFVSVFAWDPLAVLVQTGRHGEAWELLFHADRSFEKVPVEQPLEGTAIHLFRRGHVHEREAIAGAVSDALWRWCRFVPLELSFEDLEGGEGPELIQDAREPEDGELSVVHRDGDTTAVVTYDAVAGAVLARRGLVLAEGSIKALLPELHRKLGDGASHLRIFVDSARLRTTMARDKVLEDEGREKTQALLHTLVGDLRRKLLEGLEAQASIPGPWDETSHDHYAHLHAHLALERDSLGKALTEARIVRLASGEAVSVRGLSERAPSRVCVVAGPGMSSRHPRGPQLQHLIDLGDAPVVVGRPDELDVLTSLLERGALWPAHFERMVHAAALQESAQPLASAVTASCARGGLGTNVVQIGAFTGGPDSVRALVGVALCERVGSVVLVAADPPPALTPPSAGLWLNAEHPVVVAALRLWSTAPDLATAALAQALRFFVRGAADGPSPAELSEAVFDTLETAR